MCKRTLKHSDMNGPVDTYSLASRARFSIFTHIKQMTWIIKAKKLFYSYFLLSAQKTHQQQTPTSSQSHFPEKVRKIILVNLSIYTYTIMWQRHKSFRVVTCYSLHMRNHISILNFIIQVPAWADGWKYVYHSGLKEKKDIKRCRQQHSRHLWQCWYVQFPLNL